MPGWWSITARPSSGTAATATQSNAAAATSGGQIVRLRAIQGVLSGGTAGTDQLVVRDGNSGTGKIIFQADLSIATNGTAMVSLADLDLRASVGNNLTVEFVNGVTSDQEDVNGQGDFVPIGYPFGVT